jgi:hypothetical protein
VPFDFHGECKNLDWSGLTVLRRMIEPDIKRFGFFASSVANPSDTRTQTGYFRSNCMDCLDRTNVAQAMIAKESLKYQLRHLGIINETCLDLDTFDEFSGIFRNRKYFFCVISIFLVWADNGDECSRQYAGTGALKVRFYYRLAIIFNFSDRLHSIWKTNVQWSLKRWHKFTYALFQE